jgi:hypothetical protein
MKATLWLTLFVIGFLACTRTDYGSVQSEKQADDEMIIQISELSKEQEAAFEALNKLQVSTDERNRLYSTFAGIEHECYPPDSTLTLPQAEFLKAMNQFVTKHCGLLNPEERQELAAESVLAQEEYTILLCFGDTALSATEPELPMTGTWIIPNVLNRRDVILVW